MTNDRTDLPAIAVELQRMRVSSSTVADVARRVDSGSYLELMAYLRDTTETLEQTRWAVARADTMGVAPADDAELDEATETLLRAAQRRSRAIGPRQAMLLGQLLVERRRTADLHAVFRRLPLSPYQAQLLRTDLANPAVDPESNHEAWAGAFAAWISGDQASDGPEPAPVRLAAAGDAGTPFDRLDCAVPAGTAGGELVTVVVSSFRPGPELITSVRSIVRQTWRDLEILVVDDASGPEYADVYQAVAALDPRVRVLVQNRNGGTYAARNRAIDEAKGTYVTFQDADDWSHPERVERSVAALAGKPAVIAVRTAAIKMSDDLVLSRRMNPTRIPVAPTLMFRRAQVWPLLGSFDLVRKAADTEFHHRLEAALPGRVVDLEEPLLLMRMSEGSLSRDEFRSGWRHPARLLYRSAMETWHEDIRRGVASPHLGRGERRFPAPRRFAVAPGPAPSYDLVVLGDWRSDGPREREAAQWIELLAAADPARRVAVMHVETVSLEQRRSLWYADPVRRLLSLGLVDGLAYDDDVQAENAVCIDPTVLSFLPRSRCGLRSERVVIVTDRAETSHGAPLSTYDAVFTERVAKETFGGEVVWSPRGPGAAGLLPVGRAVTPAALPTAIVPQSVARLRSQDGVVAVMIGELSGQALDEASETVRVLAAAGLDVRVRAAGHVRRRIERDVEEARERGELDAARAPLLFLSDEITDRVLQSVAHDLVLVAPWTPTVRARIVAEAVAAGTVVHIRADAPHSGLPVVRYDSLDELARRLTGSTSDGAPGTEQPAVADAVAVERWFAGLSLSRVR